MTTDRKRVLALAVAYNRIGCVFLIDGKLKDWRHSRAAGKSVSKAKSFLRMAVGRYEPDLVTMEDPYRETRKHGRSLSVLQALAQDLADGTVPHRLVMRNRPFTNKYDEAADLAKEYPELTPWVPRKPKIWEAVPPETIYFEALALSLTAFEDEGHGPRAKS